MSGRRAAVLGALLLVLAVFPNPVFRGHVLFERDIHALFWGQCEAFVHAVGGGAWPVWNALLGFGQPMLANPGAQVLYPLTWLNLLVRPETYFTVYAIVHLAWAALGMLVLCRIIGLGGGASSAASALWTLSGPLLSAVDLWQHFAGAAWMPWVVAAAAWALARPSPLRTLGWGLVQAMQVLTGSLDLVVLTALPQLGVLLGRLDWRRPLARTNGRVLAAAAAAVLVTVGTTAALWLPALSILGHTGRAAGASSGQTLWSLRPLALLQCLVPVVTTDLPLRREVRLLLGDGREPLLSSLYLGLPALALVLAAAASARRRLAAAATALVALGLLFALGRHNIAYFWATAVLPPLEILRYPAKATILSALGFALLGGIGLEAWRAGRLRRRRLLAVSAVAALLGVVTLFVVVWGRHAASTLFSPAPDNPLVPGVLEANLALVSWSGALALVVAGLAGLGALVPTRRARLGAAAGVLAVLDLLVANHGLNPTVPRALVQGSPPVVTLLRVDGARRLYVFDYILQPLGGAPLRPTPPPGLGLMPRAMRFLAQTQAYPASPARWGFQGSFDPDVVELDSPRRRSLRLLAIAVSRNPEQLLRLLQLGGVDHVVSLHRTGLDLLQLAAVLYQPDAGEVYVFRVPDTLPRVSVVAAIVVADGVDAFKAALDPSFDPHSTVLLPSGETRAAPPGFEGWAEVLEERDDLLRVRCEATASSYLVMPAGYDPDWTARVDGVPAPVLRGNVAFRAVPLPPGTHEVTLAYRPGGLVVGLAVSAASILASSALLAVAALAARRRPGGDGGDGSPTSGAPEAQ